MFADELERAERAMDTRAEQALGATEAELERASRELAEARALLQEVRRVSESQAREQKQTERELHEALATERAARLEAERVGALPG
jgi:hypothetical protein